MINNFTVFITDLRNAKEYTLRKAASKLHVSAPFLSDLEKGNRLPSRKTLDAIIDLYSLDEENKRKLYDAEAEARDDIPQDVKDFLKTNKDAMKSVIEMMSKQKVLAKKNN